VRFLARRVLTKDFRSLLSSDSIELIELIEYTSIKKQKMNEYQLGGNMLKLFPVSKRGAEVLGTRANDSAAAPVRLLEAPRRGPETLIEEQLAARLRAGPIPRSTLVAAVAAELYRDELSKGAGVLDIGLFGSRLFSGEVIQALKAANGILWEIREPTGHE
jgi:hypothetical protein